MGLQIPITESPSLKSSARRPGLDKADIAVRHYSLNFEMAVDRHQGARKAVGRFVDDSPLEGSGFELVVPRHESPRFPDQRKQGETADTKPKRACLAAVTSARRPRYIAAVELDLAVGGYPGSVQRAVERADSKFESHCDRWLAIEPRPRLLELRGQSKQRRLVAVARDKLNRDR
jgi:hypothetical protein